MTQFATYEAIKFLPISSIIWTLDFVIVIISVIFSRVRCLSAAQAQPQKTQKEGKKALREKAKHNQSFVHNLFRGQVEHSQVFPYPIALNQEQTEYVSAFIDPVTKFFTEVNDANKNDMNAVRSKVF